MWRCSQLKSLLSVSAPLTIRYAVSLKPRHGQVRFDAAALVQPLRVDHLAGRDATSLAQTRLRMRAASAPSSRNLANEDWSNRPTALRTARCSFALCSNQFWRP